MCLSVIFVALALQDRDEKDAVKQPADDPPAEQVANGAGEAAAPAPHNALPGLAAPPAQNGDQPAPAGDAQQHGPAANPVVPAVEPSANHDARAEAERAAPEQQAPALVRIQPLPEDSVQQRVPCSASDAQPASDHARNAPRSNVAPVHAPPSPSHAQPVGGFAVQRHRVPPAVERDVPQVPGGGGAQRHHSLAPLGQAQSAAKGSAHRHQEAQNFAAPSTPKSAGPPQNGKTLDLGLAGRVRRGDAVVPPQQMMSASNGSLNNGVANTGVCVDLNDVAQRQDAVDTNAQDSAGAHDANVTDSLPSAFESEMPRGSGNSRLPSDSSRLNLGPQPPNQPPHEGSHGFLFSAKAPVSKPSSPSAFTPFQSAESRRSPFFSTAARLGASFSGFWAPRSNPPSKPPAPSSSGSAQLFASGSSAPVSESDPNAMEDDPNFSEKAPHHADQAASSSSALAPQRESSMPSTSASSSANPLRRSHGTGNGE